VKHAWLALVHAVGAAASAQIITTPGITASLDLTWQEDPAYPHNDNGVLEPGERALLLMSLSFSGQLTVVHIAPVQNDTGTILGLGSAFVDIRSLSGTAIGLYNNGVTAPPSSSTGPNADNLGTSGYGVRGGWRLGGNLANGQPAANGFANIGPGQLPVDPIHASTANPIQNIDRLSWAPTSYAPRTQVFAVAPAAGTNNNVVGLYLQLGVETGGAGYLPTSSITFGAVNIPIVPSPPGHLILEMAIVSACRRGRRKGRR
jgi:hypothetical protein